MSDNRMTQTDASVEAYLAAIDDPQKQADARELAAIMGEISGEPATMWGPSIVGFGSRKYTYSSGHSGETMLIGFAARKSAITLYGSGYLEDVADVLSRMGKAKTGKGCVYIKRLSDVDPAALREFLSLQFQKASALPEKIETVSQWSERKKELGR